MIFRRKAKQDKPKLATPLADRMDAYADVLCGIRYYTPKGEDTFSDSDLRLTLRRGAEAIRTAGRRAAEDKQELLIRTAIALADAAPWRQTPDMDVLKSVVNQYRASIRDEEPAHAAP